MRAGDFQPISLSNSLYLIMAKVLANRLQEVIDELVDPFQLTFIPGQQLVDRAVMAGEIITEWRRSATKGFLWKVDFAKAFNSINWKFLWSSMMRRGFPVEWVSWVCRCITSHSSMLVNGSPAGGWIHPQRGVKQGCPLTLFLFVLAVDALAKSTRKACDWGLLKGYQTASYPGGIPILQNADDTSFFILGSVEEARNLSTLLDLFADFSGLQINQAKSVFLGFGQSQEEDTLCSAALGTPIGALPMRYLGLPLTASSLTSTDYLPIIEKVERQLEGWKARVLSRPGRLVLLRSVLMMIPIFYLSVFKLPRTVHNRLVRLMRRFF